MKGIYTMDKIYACLLGEWVCLNDDSDCKIGGEHLYTLDEWLDGNSEIYAPFKRKNENLFFNQDYVSIVYKGKSYSISPVFIQTVSE
ncbi:MAG: hypothetical protein ACFNTU_06495 [Catonella sp.]